LKDGLLTKFGLLRLLLRVPVPWVPQAPRSWQESQEISKVQKSWYQMSQLNVKVKGRDT